MTCCLMLPGWISGFEKIELNTILNVTFWQPCHRLQSYFLRNLYLPIQKSKICIFKKPTALVLLLTSSDKFKKFPHVVYCACKLRLLVKFSGSLIFVSFKVCC